MKNILTFEDFILESTSYNDFDKNDRDLIFELNYMYNLLNSKNNRRKDIYESNLFSLYSILIENDEDNSFSLNEILFEDAADDLESDVSARKELGLGDKSFLQKVGSALGWIAFPIKAASELIKLIQKKNKIRKLLKNIEEGPKKDKLRAELNKLSKAQVEAVAQLKQARMAKKYGAEFVVKDSYNYDEGLIKLMDIFEAKGKISAEQKEKIMKQAEAKGKADGKSLASKAQSIADKVAEDPEKKKEVLDKLKDSAETKKQAWEKIKKQAEAEGISLG